MKYKSVYQIFLIILVSFSGYIVSAQSNPLEKKATLAIQKAPLEDVLDLITQQTGVRFSYNSQVINPKTKVTVYAQNKTIKEILSIMLPASVSYKKAGNHIVFFIAKKTPTNIISTSSPTIQEIDSSKFKKNKFSNNGNTKVDCLDSVSLEKDSIKLEEDSMKSQVAGIMLAIAAASTSIMAQDTLKAESVQNNKIQEVREITEVEEIIFKGDTSTRKCKPFQLTFVYPIGTSGAKSAENTYHLSINVLGGVTGQIKGVEAGSLFNINKYGAMGAQFAGLFNKIGAKDSTISSYNAQFAGVFNYTQKGKSAQYAGVFNVGDMVYFQAAGIGNFAKRTEGAQFAGIFNIAPKGKSVQFAGIFNIGDTTYFQAGGIFNISKQSNAQFAGIFNIVKQASFQAAGIYNVAKESKCQLAGIVNITKKGKFQMGLINVRDTADGVSLGLINIVKKGGVLEAGIEGGEFIHTAATFRSGVQRLYSIISVGVNYTDKFWTVGIGLGTSFKLGGNLGLNLELTNTNLYKPDIFVNGRKVIFGRKSFIQFSPVFNYRFAKHFKMYIGPSFNLFACYYHNHHDYTPPIYQVKIPYSFYSRAFNDFNNTKLDMWIGIKGGIKF